VRTEVVGRISSYQSKGAGGNYGWGGPALRTEERKGSPAGRAAATPAWRQRRAREGGGLARWAGYRPAQHEHSYFLFIQPILNCPEFESTKWRTSQTQNFSNKIWF
jgi:hypothetical protein